jgi:hypothetical protein
MFNFSQTARIPAMTSFARCISSSCATHVPPYEGAAWHDRIRWALFKPGLLAGCTAPLPPVSWTNHNQFADREFFYLLEVSVERVGRDTTFGRILSAII